MSPSPWSGVDINAVVGGLLRDLAFAHAARPQMFGYKRAAAAIFALDQPLTALVDPVRRAAADRRHRTGVGAGDSRSARGRRIADRRARDRCERQPRRYRAAARVTRPFPEPRRGPAHPSRSRARRPVPPAITAATCRCTRNGATAARASRTSARRVCARGYRVCGGHRSFTRLEDRRRHVDGRRRPTNAAPSNRSMPDAGFRLLQGIEANIGAEGRLDLSAEEARLFEVVLAAPHSRLRATDDQTTACRRRRESGGPDPGAPARPDQRLPRRDCRRLGAVFAAAARAGVAVEIDGDPVAPGPRPHAGRGGARGRLPVRPRQRRARDRAAGLC